MKNIILLIVITLFSINLLAQEQSGKILGHYLNYYNNETDSYEGWEEIQNSFIGNMEFYEEVYTIIIPATTDGGVRTRIILNDLKSKETTERGTVIWEWITTIHYDYNDKDSRYNIPITIKEYPVGEKMGLVVYREGGVVEIQFNKF